MARCELPLRGKLLWATGEVLLRAEIQLLAKTGSQAWVPLLFRVDSGADVTHMPASLARQLGLPFPQRPVSGLQYQQTREEVRAGMIRAQIPGLGNTEFVFPCYFIGDPLAPIPTSNKAPNLLGLSGVVDKVRITFDGEAKPAAPYGIVILEEM